MNLDEAHDALLTHAQETFDINHKENYRKILEKHEANVEEHSGAAITIEALESTNDPDEMFRIAAYKVREKIQLDLAQHEPFSPDYLFYDTKTNGDEVAIVFGTIELTEKPKNTERETQ